MKMRMKMKRNPSLEKELMEPIVEKLKQQSRSGERAQVVEIAGAVREPGEYPLIGEGSISSTIALAGGFRQFLSAQS